MERPAPATVTQLFAAAPERRLALLRAVWPGVVGPDLARRSVVVAFDRGILRVQVPDAAWRRVLVRMRAEILARLRRVAGPAAPRGLGFVEGPLPVLPVTPPARVPGVSPSVAPPLVRAAADTIPDPELRARFVDAVARYLARFEALPEPAPPDRLEPPER